MKTFINYIVTGLLLMTVSCQKDPQLHTHITDGFYEVSADFIYPAQAENNYVILLDGDTLKGGLAGNVDRMNNKVKVEVFEKGKQTAEFAQEVEITNSHNLQFIKIPGQAVTIYDAEKYTTLNPTVLFQQGTDENYRIFFNGTELQNRTLNYLLKANLSGKFEIRKKGDNSVLYEQDLTISSGSQLNVMQLSASDFLLIPDDNEPDPQTKQYTKVRFFYTQDAFPQSKELHLVIYYADFAFSDFYEAKTIVLKPGELSDYILIDHFHFGEKYVNGVYDLIDPATNTKIVDNSVHFETVLAFGSNNSTLDGGYKFETIRFTDATHTGGDNVKSTGIPELRKVW
ncbi:hypothetical protein ACR78Z_12800 [Sphingobacterium thalpophilum]|uniref:hypothetical protein n=1 Tax=Sphingobacterium thalpophilum TaxID=259 RepID=UPI003DA6CDD2